MIILISKVSSDEVIKPQCLALGDIVNIQASCFGVDKSDQSVSFRIDGGIIRSGIEVVYKSDQRVSFRIDGGIIRSEIEVNSVKSFQFKGVIF